MPPKRPKTVGCAQQRAEPACTARDLRVPMALLPDRNPIGLLQARSESPRRLGSKMSSADPTERPSRCQAVLGPWSLVLGPWSLVLGPHSDSRLSHCHPFLPFPAAAAPRRYAAFGPRQARAGASTEFSEIVSTALPRLGYLGRPRPRPCVRLPPTRSCCMKQTALCAAGTR